jgi:hypothetical protein
MLFALEAALYCSLVDAPGWALGSLVRSLPRKDIALAWTVSHIRRLF